MLDTDGILYLDLSNDVKEVLVYCQHISTWHSHLQVIQYKYYNCIKYVLTVRNLNFTIYTVHVACHFIGDNMDCW